MQLQAAREATMDLKTLDKINDHLWEIPQHGEMRVPGRIFASEKLIEEMDEKVREQVTNVAMLPGIQIASLAMPDAHWGYGFPIGGVAAFDPDEGGIISMGGVGFDISCGVRTMKTGMTREEVLPRLKKLIDLFYSRVPAGVGSEGLIELSSGQIDEMLLGGAVWAVKKGYGNKDDLDYIEEHGRVDGADPDNVSDAAKKRQQREMDRDRDLGRDTDLVLEGGELVDHGAPLVQVALARIEIEQAQDRLVQALLLEVQGDGVQVGGVRGADDIIR
jgi:tRNA-splicing ligase RtcB